MLRPPPLSIRRAALFVLTSCAIAACKGVEDTKPTVAGPADVGGTVVIATSTDAGAILPQLVAGALDRQIADLLFDRLAEIGAALNTVGDKGFTPQLAERWEWANDSLSIAFHINPHAQWHDGRPVRASDVRYSIVLAKDPAHGA